MESRFGTRVREASTFDGTKFGRDLGEDWVVPKMRAHYLVAERVHQGALLTAYDALGRVVAEAFRSDLETLVLLLETAHAEGVLEPIRQLPSRPASALAFLDGPAA